MIFITVGTHERPFLRLFQEVEKLIAGGKIKEEVVCQTGFTKYEVKGAKCRDYYPEDEMQRYLKTCRVLVTHGGLGSIMKGIDLGKPVVAVPRRARFNEHTDDHQLQIVQEMEKQGLVTAVYNIVDLFAAIRRAERAAVNQRAIEKPPVFGLVERQLKAWSSP